MIFSLILNKLISFKILVYIITIYYIILNILIQNEKNIYILKLITINKKFHNNLNKSRKCKFRKCIIKCLLRKESNKIFKKYKESDIPGPYPYDYPYIDYDNKICRKNTYIFISVIMLCRELEERIAIRKIYKYLKSSIKIHFFIGYTTNKCQKEYNFERKLFKDISQVPIQESYVNQTLFTLYLHKILPKICPYAKYYGKMDADQYINFPKLINLLNRNENMDNIIYSCDSYIFKYINTNQTYKYSSSKIIERYYKKVFPKNGIKGFTGSFTLYPSYISSILYKESLNEKHIIRMEDQHIAWLIYKINLKNMNITFYNLKCYDINMNINSCSFSYNREYGIHRIKGENLFSLYNFYNKK